MDNIVANKNNSKTFEFPVGFILGAACGITIAELYMQIPLREENILYLDNAIIILSAGLGALIGHKIQYYAQPFIDQIIQHLTDRTITMAETIKEMSINTMMTRNSSSAHAGNEDFLV